MTMWIPHLCRYGRAIALGLVLTAAGGVLATAQEDPVKEEGRIFCDLFYDGELEEIWKYFSPDMRSVFGTVDSLRAFRREALGFLGSEVVILDETTGAENGQMTYRRIARFENTSQLARVEWAFDADWMVTAFLIWANEGEAPSTYLEYETRTPLRLPFNDEWFVFWGGRTVALNYHASTMDQRFAYDILIMKDGSTHRGSGSSNEDYYCFDKPIHAPGPGVIVAVENEVAENIPGAVNTRMVFGNHVIIDHRNGEFSFLAHFKQGSIEVELGDVVATGRLLGLCGNSGNSTEPHLHYHLQTAPTYHEGVGLPAQFRDYVADGKSVARGEPVKGQRIKPEPDAARGAK